MSNSIKVRNEYETIGGHEVIIMDSTPITDDLTIFQGVVTGTEPELIAYYNGDGFCLITSDVNTQGLDSGEYDLLTIESESDDECTCCECKCDVDEDEVKLNGYTIEVSIKFNVDAETFEDAIDRLNGEIGDKFEYEIVSARKD